MTGSGHLVWSELASSTCAGPPVAGHGRVPPHRLSRDIGWQSTAVDAGMPGWSGVTWSDLSDTDVDGAISAEVAAFAATGRRWEWKYYSYDQPPTLPARLRAHGLVPDVAETLMIARIGDVDLHVAPPRGVDVVRVRDEAGVDALVQVHDQAFGGDHNAVGRSVLADLADRPDAGEAFVAYADATPISAGRVSFHAGTDFAGLWG